MERRHALSGAALDGKPKNDRVRMAHRRRRRTATALLPHSQRRTESAAGGTRTMDGSPHNPAETMENQTSFDLNAAVQRWRAGLAESSSFRKDDLDELEAHVRDSVETLRAPSLSEEEAFLIAVRRTGPAKQLAAEFARVNGSSVWLDRIRWITIGWIGGPVLFGMVGVVSFALLPVSEIPIVSPPLAMIEAVSALAPFGILPLLLMIALRSNPLRNRLSAVLALTAGFSLFALTIARTFPFGALLAPVKTPVAL